MGKNYAIMRFKKYSSLSTAMGSERHGIERHRLLRRAHPEREHENAYKYGPCYSGCTSLTEAFVAATKDVSTTIRKDAVRVVELILTASDMDAVELKPWISQNTKWLFDTFGKENLLSLRLDMDEKSPHLHAYVCPVVRDKKGVRLSARHWLNGKAKCSQLQDSYADAMACFGLSRGDKENQKHLDSKIYWEIQEEINHSKEK